MSKLTTLINNIIDNGFNEIEHTETYRDGSPVYDSENYRYFKLGNYSITVSTEFGSVVVEKTEGSKVVAFISSNVSDFYVSECSEDYLTIGIGFGTEIIL